MKESLHLQRLVADNSPQPVVTATHVCAVNLRTVEHYRLVHGLDGEIDQELPQ
jgi:hypothetical protein